MSNVTSQSELTTKEIVEQAIQDYHNTILPYLAKGNNGYSETPIGAMQMFDDDTAPSGWLVADGTIYNISDYPFLAKHIERVHGSKNHYGGDGTTTFSVPDWQGEFFRASGTNSHTNQGSGGAVGEHQDGTIIPNIFNTTNDRNIINFSCDNNGIIDFRNGNPDTINRRYNNVEVNGTYSAIGQPLYHDITSRPTNTSLLCCIKAVPAGINYSLEEQEIGTLIDGKKLYQKTFANINVSTTWNSAVCRGEGSYTNASVEALNIDTILFGGIITSAKGCNYARCHLAATNTIGILLPANDDMIKDLTIQYTKTTD